MCEQGSKNFAFLQCPHSNNYCLPFMCYKAIVLKKPNDIPAMKLYCLIPTSPFFDQVHSLSLVLNKATSELAKASVSKLAAHLEVTGESAGLGPYAV